MGKKKGKVLALELVGDLFDKNKSKDLLKKNKAKKNIENPTEVLDVPKALPVIDEEPTEKVSRTELLKAQSTQLSLKGSKSYKDLSLNKSLTIEGTLSQSNNLKRAQDKILQLEKVIEDLRRDNEKLLSATETFKNNDDELQIKISNLKFQLSDAKEQLSDEKKLILEGKKVIERQLRDAKLEIEQLNNRLNTNLKKIRVRERELENRLEILKLENNSLQRTKDEHLLELKRQLDNSSHEIDSYKHKGNVLDLELQKNKNMLRKTVKALRLALTMLEMDEQQFEKVPGDES